MSYEFDRFGLVVAFGLLDVAVQRSVELAGLVEDQEPDWVQVFGAEVAVLACLACLASPASELEEHLSMEFVELGHGRYSEVPGFPYHLEALAFGYVGGFDQEQPADLVGWRLEEY